MHDFKKGAITLKNRTDHEKRRSRFTRKFKRCLASAACVLGVAAVCFGVAGYQNRIHAEDDQVVTRGVINSLGQIPLTKKTMYDNDDDQYMHTLGTKENPFFILEVVPYEEYATFGYHISGCEPVDPKTNYGHSKAMDLTNTLKTAKATPQRNGISPAHFFEDEPESKPDAYDNDKVPIKDGGSINQSYEGYYEMVEDGQGTFIQDDSGRISKGTDADKEKRNIIWHTVCTTEKQAKFADKTFTDASDSYEILKNVGDRIYTKRVSTNEDQAYVTYGYYYYQNNDDFIKYSLLQKKAGEEIDQDEVDNYCVIIKTITPKELNGNPEWADYADLYFVSRSDYQGGTTAEIWKKYNRLNHTSNTTTYTNSFANTDSDKNRDISWEVAEKIFNKVTADKNYAGMIMGSSVYSVDSYEGSTKSETDMQLYDWNLKKIYNEVDNKYATVSSGTKSNANMFKLSLMLLSMDTDLFKDLYMNKDNPLIKNGEFLLRDGDDRTYWSKTTFLLMDSTDVENLRKPYQYWISDESWEKYGIAVELSSYRVWVKGHFYSFNDDNSITFDYTQTASKPDSKFTDYQDYLDKFYDKKDSGGKPSDAVRYILGDRNKYEKRIKGELNILDIEPCYDSKNGYSLQESYIRMMIPKFRGTINITHMTTAQFIGSAEDLNSTYNMIFMGLDQGAYNTKAATIDGKNGIYTYWNDPEMKGKIYFHTGDKMTGANYTEYVTSRSVEFLYSQKSNSNVSGQELRFAGNDITTIKKAELEDFLKAGYPIVAVPYLYDTDSIRIDQHSNICRFIQSNRSSGTEKNTTLLKTSDTNGIYSVVKESRAKVEFTKLPEKYNGDTGSGTKVTNPNYLSRDSRSQRSLMTFGFKVDDKANKTYSCRIYLDQNQDGKFADDESYYTGKKFKANDGEQTVQIKLSKLYYGLIQWKIEVYEVKADANDRSVRFVKTGCSAAKNMAGNGKKEINVLQIMPELDGDYSGKLDLSSNQMFKKYYSDLEDYSISITPIKLDDFEKKFIDKPFTSYDYSKTLTDADYDNISKELSSDQQGLYNNYQMYIIGFGDMYDGKDLDNTYGMVDFLKFYIASGKSVLFTHDLTSFHNQKAGDYGYSANTLLRDVMGMNRYKAISKNVPDKQKLINYQSKRSYDTVTDINGNELEQKHGFTYYALKRLGWTSDQQNYNKDQTVPYQYMITSSETGKPICDIDEIVARTGFINTNDLTTKVEQSNQGQITEYPYKIDESFTISPTHGQYYQLDMEDPEVTVWYTLADDGKHKVCENIDGTAVTYGVSPKDAANNYYIYSRENVFYSGVGHSEITQEMEAKLFINTMIAAYRASYEPPMIEIMNPDAEITDVNTMNYQMTANNEYNDDDATTSGSSSASGKVQFEGQGADNNDYIKVRFSPVELNAISTTLTCSIYYEADGATHYVQRIYDADTDKEIDSTLKDGKCVYEGLQNMHEYYFYYPKKYLNEWKDGSTTKSARRTINFYIKNNKAKLPRYQTLDMSVRALFRLD